MASLQWRQGVGCPLTIVEMRAKEVGRATCGISRRVPTAWMQASSGVESSMDIKVVSSSGGTPL